MKQKCECLEDKCPGLGDGYCDDTSNTEECYYDNGDCCDNANVNWNYNCNVSRIIICSFYYEHVFEAWLTKLSFLCSLIARQSQLFLKYFPARKGILSAVGFYSPGVQANTVEARWADSQLYVFTVPDSACLAIHIENSSLANHIA